MKKFNQKGIAVGIIVAIVAAVVLGGAYYVYKTRIAEMTYEQAKKMEDTIKEVAEPMDSGLEDSDSAMEGSDSAVENSDGSYTGTMQKMMMLGIPLKCTYSVEGNQFEGYLKGKKFRGNVQNADGTSGGVAIDDDCMYVWEDGEERGWTFCLEDGESYMDEDVWEDKDENNMDSNIAAEYNCRPAIVTDADLAPPTNVDFMDFDELMNSMMEEMTESDMVDMEDFEGMMEN